MDPHLDVMTLELPRASPQRGDENANDGSVTPDGRLSVSVRGIKIISPDQMEILWSNGEASTVGAGVDGRVGKEQLITIESLRRGQPRRFHAAIFLLPLPRRFHERIFRSKAEQQKALENNMFSRAFC
jgi:hypothetical protein